MPNKALIISVVIIVIIAIGGIYLFVLNRQFPVPLQTQGQPSPWVISSPVVQTKANTNDNLDQALKDLDLISNQ